MFISNAEKNYLQEVTRSMQAVIAEMTREAAAMKQAIINLEAQVENLKKTPRKPAKQKRARTPIIRTPEAPWGVKKDGTPRKRPGRALKEAVV